MLVVTDYLKVDFCGYKTGPTENGIVSVDPQPQYDLQYKCRRSSHFPFKNVDIIVLCPCQVMIFFYWKWPIICFKLN